MYQSLCTWIVVHLFALAVCHKNLSRLEPLYVVSSVLLSSVMAVVSLALVFVANSETHTCSSDCSAFKVFVIKRRIEGIIACLLILLNCASMIATGLILCHRAYGKRNGHNGHRSLSDQQHKKALCEMLPLLITALRWAEYVSSQILYFMLLACYRRNVWFWAIVSSVM